MTDTEGKEVLLRVVIQLVQKQLATQGLKTFGAILGEQREIELLVPEEVILLRGTSERVAHAERLISQ